MIRSQVSARTALMQRCNAERFGGRMGSIRVNRLAEAESASTNSSSR